MGRPVLECMEQGLLPIGQYWSCSRDTGYLIAGSVTLWSETLCNARPGSFLAASSSRALMAIE